MQPDSRLLLRPSLNPLAVTLAQAAVQAGVAAEVALLLTGRAAGQEQPAGTLISLPKQLLSTTEQVWDVDVQGTGSSVPTEKSATEQSATALSKLTQKVRERRTSRRRIATPDSS